MQTVGLEQAVQKGEQASQLEVELFQYLELKQVEQMVKFPIVEQVWQLGMMAVHSVHPPVS